MSARADDCFVVAAGYRLHVRRIEGTATAAPTLVFLHQGLGTIGIWGDVPEVLCRATASPGMVYERPGYGASDPRPPPWPDDVLEQEAEIVLPALLCALGIERPVLVGHSDGGTIALLFAAAFPERVRAVITEGAHVVMDELTLAGVSDLHGRGTMALCVRSSSSTMALASRRCSTAGAAPGSRRRGAPGRSSIASRASPARSSRSRAPMTSTACRPSSTRSPKGSAARPSASSSRTAATTRMIRRGTSCSSAWRASSARCGVSEARRKITATANERSIERLRTRNAPSARSCPAHCLLSTRAAILPTTGGGSTRPVGEQPVTPDVLLRTKRKPAAVGEILVEEFMRPLGLTQGALAEAMGVPRKRVNQLCNDRRAVTAPTALILARVFGNSPDFWLNVQRRTDLWDALHSPRERGDRAREALAERGVEPWPVPRSQFMESARVPRIPRSTCARLGRALRKGLRGSWMEHFSNA